MPVAGAAGRKATKGCDKPFPLLYNANNVQVLSVAYHYRCQQQR